MRGCKQRAWRRLALAVLIVCGLGVLPAAALADAATINATLIRASNESGAKAGKKPGVPGVLNFNSQQNVGGGSATIQIPGSGTIALGQGNSLTVRLSPSEGKKVVAAINWRGPSGPVLNTTVRLTRGGPGAILGGGPKQGGGTMMISVSAR